MVHNEDRELQIRLAELQADVQINLTIGFGFLAGCLALSIMFTQIAFAVPPENIILKNMARAFSLFWVIVAFLSGRYFVSKALDARKQMKDLKKQYVW